VIQRWVEGQVARSGSTASHLVLDKDTGLLYVADTGNNRIAVLDTNSGVAGQNLPVVERGTTQTLWEDATFNTLVEGTDYGMLEPSGIALVEGTLVVTDAGTARIHVFDLDGNELDWADTGRNKLGGVYADSLSDIWMVDPGKDQVLRLQP
jgi:DNA-binding beta-propeller fold protein YncE